MFIRAPPATTAIYGTRAKRTRLVYECYTSREFPLQLKGGQSHYYSVGAEIQFDFVLEQNYVKLNECKFNAQLM